MARLSVENISFTYPDRQGGFQALQDLSFDIRDGEFVCLIGRSGCGKSTLLKILAGLERADSGQVLSNGQAITGPAVSRAMVFQNYSLFPWMTVAGNIAFGLAQAQPGLSRGQCREAAEGFLARVGLAGQGSRWPNQLSGGMLQRAALARALAMDPDTLLLDEPFGALDARRRAQLQDLLLQLWQAGERKKTVLFVTHDIDEALYLADRIVFMRPGQIIACLLPPWPRPRDREAIRASAAYGRLKETLLDFFRLDGEDDYESLA